MTNPHTHTGQHAYGFSISPGTTPSTTTQRGWGGGGGLALNDKADGQRGRPEDLWTVFADTSLPTGFESRKTYPGKDKTQ